MREKAAALLLVCASMIFCVSCVGTNANRYLYAAIPGSNEIVIYREDPNSGILTQLAGSPVTAGVAVESLVAHPNNKLLFAANAGENDISVFRIATSGGLNEVTPRQNVGTAPTVLAMDASGTFLYVGNSGSLNVSVFSINATSKTQILTEVAGSPFPIGMTPLNMAVSPSGKFLYVTGTGLPGFIEAFSLNQGVPSVVQGTPFVTGAGPYGLAIAPSGSFLYTANKLDNSLSEFTVNGDGSLTQFANSPIGEQFSGPLAMFIDKSGKYLFVTNQGSANVAVFAIGTGSSNGNNGALTLVPNSPFATGTQPSVVTGDPGGNYVFVGSQSNSSVQSFQLNTNNGTLTSVNTYRLPGAPTSFAVTR